MRSLLLKQGYAMVLKMRLVLMFGLIALATSGCGPESTDGVVTNAIVLPTDTVLNLSCENVGINTETCVLTDPENPFRFVTIVEPDANTPDDVVTKFDLNDTIPTGAPGAKARFYLWATALARRPTGENQWYTSRALHRVYTYNGDELIRQQALKAYRSNLDNFFGSLVYFNEFGFSFPATLNEQVACDIYRPPPGFTEIALDENGLPSPDLGKLELFGSWGYTFIPGPDANDPCANSVLVAGVF